MAEPYIGQIMQTAWFRYAPNGWGRCDGTILQISQYQAVFSLFGNAYGGDGKATFALPDLRGRVMIGSGQAPFGNYNPATPGGSSAVTLTEAQMPTHDHPAAVTGNPTVSGNLTALSGVSAASVSNTPSDGGSLANTANAGVAQVKIYAPAGASGTPVNLNGVSLQVNAGDLGLAVGVAGSGEPVSIMPPYMPMLTMIALTGIYPSPP